MAEGFARTYGADVLEAVSAGLGPAVSVSPMTIETMKEKNIDMSDAVPKGVDEVNRDGVSLLVNISGQKLPVRGVPLVEWNVRDPIGRDAKVFREVRDEIERRVMELILQMRAEERRESAAAGGTQNPPPGFDTRGRRSR
jgi:protein-tyrosine-phosphatase